MDDRSTRRPRLNPACALGAATWLLLSAGWLWGTDSLLAAPPAGAGVDGSRIYVPAQPFDDSTEPDASGYRTSAAFAGLRGAASPVAEGDPDGELSLTSATTAPNDADRITSLEKQVAALSKQLKAAAGGKSDKGKGDKKDEFPSVKITGFLQLDTAYYGQTANNIATVGDAQDGTGFRRARLAAMGKVAEFTNYQLEVDFAAAGRPSFFDNYVEQGNIPWLGAVKIGHFLQPFSVDAMSGFRNLVFLERSLPFLAFVPFRRVGVQCSYLTEDEMTQWAYSGYRTGGLNNAPLGDSQFATDFGDVGGYSFSTRITHLIQYDQVAGDRYLWHVGGGYNFSMLGANTGTGAGGSPAGATTGGPNPNSTTTNAGSAVPFYSTRVLPEFGPVGYLELPQPFGQSVNGTPTFVSSGKYQATDFHLFGVETVYQAGPLSMQSEYMVTLVDTPWGQVFYHGAYGQAAYRLTGEHRLYDKKLGALRNPIPYTDFIPLGPRGICGWGAWEVAARLSFVDLRNPAFLNGHYYDNATNTFTTTSKTGNGMLTDTTLGVTWFLNYHTKLQFNWIHAMLNNSAKGFSQADLFVSRVQVDY